jgi:hypothetical protein
MIVVGAVVLGMMGEGSCGIPSWIGAINWVWGGTSSGGGLPLESGVRVEKAIASNAARMTKKFIVVRITMTPSTISVNVLI